MNTTVETKEWQLAFAAYRDAYEFYRRATRNANEAYAAYKRDKTVDYDLAQDIYRFALRELIATSENLLALSMPSEFETEIL